MKTKQRVLINNMSLTHPSSSRAFKFRGDTANTTKSVPIEFGPEEHFFTLRKHTIFAPAVNKIVVYTLEDALRLKTIY